MQVPEIPAQRKFVSAMCHAHSNAHKPFKTVAPTVLMLEFKFYLKCIVLINTYRLTQKMFVTPTLKPTSRPQASKNRKYERGYLGNYQR